MQLTVTRDINTQTTTQEAVQMFLYIIWWISRLTETIHTLITADKIEQNNLIYIYLSSPKVINSENIFEKGIIHW